MKKYKAYKQERRVFLRLLLFFVLFQVLFVSFFCAMLYDNSQITEDDCSVVVGRVQEAYYFPTSRLIVTVDNKSYYLSGIYSNGEVPITTIASQIINKDVVILVRKARHFPYFNNKKETSIVALQCGSEVYADLNSYNSEQHTALVLSCVVMPVFWLVITVPFVIAIYVFIPDKTGEDRGTVPRLKDYFHL